MRTILIGAVGTTQAFLEGMNEAGFPPALLVTLDEQLGRKAHSDYVDLRSSALPQTRVLHIAQSGNPDTLAAIRSIDPDYIFVIGWSQILGAELRAAARRHCIGYHPTALPVLRGRAAIGWTILLGLRESGASLFVIEDDGVDSGALLAQQRFPIESRPTAGSLLAQQIRVLKAMIRELLPRLAAGGIKPIPQATTGISYGARRSRQNNLIDWRQPREMIDRLIRASARPYDGAFTFTRRRRVTIWSAEPIEPTHAIYAAVGQVVDYAERRPIVRCGDGGHLLLTEVETDSGEPMSGQILFRDTSGEEAGL